MQTQQTAPTAPVWVRSLHEPRLLASGVDWDAICVEADVGVRAVRYLEAAGIPVGPVLHDQCSNRAYFLVRPGTACAWRQDGTRALGSGSWVVLAPPGWDGLLRWVVEPTGAPGHTAIGSLASALQAAAAMAAVGEEPGR